MSADRDHARSGDVDATVQELAAKADVKARAKQAVGDATGRARQKLAGVKAQAAGVVGEKASTARQQLADSDLPEPVRRPLPLAAIAVGVVDRDGAAGVQKETGQWPA